MRDYYQEAMNNNLIYREGLNVFKMNPPKNQGDVSWSTVVASCTSEEAAQAAARLLSM